MNTLSQEAYCVEYTNTLLVSIKNRVQLDTSPMVASGYTKYIVCSSRTELYLSMPLRSLHLLVIAR